MAHLIVSYLKQKHLIIKASLFETKPHNFYVHSHSKNQFQIWMLTGDKLETATCIADSSKLVSHTQDIYTLFVLLFPDLDVNWRQARDSHVYC